MEIDLVTRLQALGMTRKDLAQSLGVSLSSIYHWVEVPKYVEAYLDSRYREHGLVVPDVQGGVVAVSEAVQLRGGEGAVVAGDGRKGAVPDEHAAPTNPVRDGKGTGNPSDVGGRRRG